MDHGPHLRLAYPCPPHIGACTGQGHHGHVPDHVVARAGLAPGWRDLAPDAVHHLGVDEACILDAGAGWYALVAPTAPTLLAGPLRWAPIAGSDRGTFDALMAREHRRRRDQSHAESLILGGLMGLVAFLVAVLATRMPGPLPEAVVQAPMATAFAAAAAIGLAVYAFSVRNKRRGSDHAGAPPLS